MAVIAAFAKQDASDYSNGVGCPSLEFFLGCHTVSVGGYLLQMDRDVFVCDKGSSVAVGEDYYDGVFV